ncbi:MAG: hypothetical protein ABSG64_06260, partial [Solirubrobacteraceae bacterium]
ARHRVLRNHRTLRHAPKPPREQAQRPAQRVTSPPNREETHKIGRISPSGTIAEYPIPTAASEPEGITTGADGALWFTETATNKIGRITAAGAIAEYPNTAGGSGPYGITSGSDGKIWFTEDRTDDIGVLDLSGDTFSQYGPTPGEPLAIAAGSDGALWFTAGLGYVGRITTSGDMSSLPTPSASSALMPIVSGPDGDLWIGVKGAPSMLDRVTTGDVFTQFDLPAGSSASVERLGVGPDGQIWLAGGGDLTSMSTGGVVDTFSGIYPSGDTIGGIAAGPSDTLWLTDATSSTIYRVSLGTPALAASLLPAASISKSSGVVSGTLSVPSGDLPEPASYSFQYGTTSAYGSSSPTVSATASPSGTQVSAPLSGLAPYTTYHYRLVATGCAPSSCSAATGDQSFTTGLTLTPVLGQSVGVAAISGKVLVRLPGKHRFVRVSAGRLIGVGSEVNARHGKVLIESATATVPEQLASGQFSGGLFVVTQPSAGTTTDLTLATSFAACKAPARHGLLERSARKSRSRSHRVVNQVFGNAHGDYSTRGHYAAAADEGTSWRIADRCDGTYVAVSNGSVEVTDFVRHRSFALTAGQHYLAAAR